MPTKKPRHFQILREHIPAGMSLDERAEPTEAPALLQATPT